MKKQKISQGIGSVFLAILLLLSLTGCGSNIFKGLSDEQLPQDTATLIESGYYEEAIAQADHIIDNPNTSIAEKQKAYADKGLAILGKNNISLGQIASVAGDFSTASDFLNGGLEQLKSKLPISEAEAQESADMLNSAYALSQSGTTSPSVSLATLSVLAPSLNTTAQFRRAFANATVVIKMATLYLDITEDGATLNSTAKSLNLSITDVFLYLTSSQRNIYYYAMNAYDAAVKSNALTTSQLSAVNNALEAAYNMQKLNVAYTQGTSFTLVNRNDESFNVYTSASFEASEDVKEARLKEALTAIYHHYK